jgi:hypothetical protein
VSILDQVGGGEANDGEEASDGVHGSPSSLDSLRNIRGCGRQVILGLGATVASLAAAAAAAVGTVVSAIIVAALLTLRRLSTMVTRIAGGGSIMVDWSTSSRNRVVGVRRRVDSSSVVAVVVGDGVSDSLGHALARVGRMRVGVGLSLGDNILTGVSRYRLMRLGLSRVGVNRLMRLAGLSWDLSDRADSCGNGDGLGSNMTHRAVDNSRGALSDSIGLGAVDRAGSVLSRLGNVGGMGVDSSEADGRLSHVSQYKFDRWIVILSNLRSRSERWQQQPQQRR